MLQTALRSHGWTLSENLIAIRDGISGSSLLMYRNFLVVDPEESMHVLKGLASPVRIRILKLLHEQGSQNINEIARILELPQSTVSANVSILEEADLIRSDIVKARKGNQKICHSNFDEVVIAFKDDVTPARSGHIEVSMPLGLYTSCEVEAPCGLCTPDGVVGLLDVPDTFLDPE